MSETPMNPHSPIIKLALHTPDNLILHIDSASKGLACNCTCMECGRKMVGVQGDKNEWHFRHEVENGCAGGQESALHKLGKQIIMESTAINVPGMGLITYTDPQLEKSSSDVRPDVTVTYKNQPLFFEIAVTHFVDELKLKRIKELKVPTVEIRLEVKKCNCMADIKNMVLADLDNKKVWNWESAPNATSGTCLVALLTWISMACFILLVVMSVF